MRHPEVLLLPVFTLLDYFLTIAGVILSEKGYDKHFAIQHYELNPVWQKQIAQKKWFNPRHLLLTVALTALMVLLMEVLLPDVPLAAALPGYVLVLFAAVLGRHISNILIFLSVLRDSSRITGHVQIEHGMMLSWSLYSYLVLVVPLAVVAVFAPHPFVLGGLLGVLTLLLVHLGWLRLHRKETKTQQAPPPPPEPDAY